MVRYIDYFRKKLHPKLLKYNLNNSVNINSNRDQLDKFNKPTTKLNVLINH